MEIVRTKWKLLKLSGLSQKRGFLPLFPALRALPRGRATCLKIALTHTFPALALVNGCLFDPFRVASQFCGLGYKGVTPLG